MLEGRAIGCHAHVERVIPCHNEHEQPARRYRIDPELFLRADRTAAAIGRTIVGVWHSHPDGQALFSDTDRAEAWPDWHYLVAAVDHASMRTLRCWHIRADGPTPGRILIHG